MPITATVDAANARIDFFIDYSTEAGTQTGGTLYRRVGSPTADLEPVRGLFGTTFLGEQAYVSDHEAPLDVELYYTVGTFPVNVILNTGPYIIPSNGYVWLKDPGRPWADLRLDLCVTPTTGPDECQELTDDLAWVGFQDKTRAMDAGLFPVLDKERPADVFARRKDISTTALFLSRSLPAIDSVYELFTAGGPLLIQVLNQYGMQSPYGLSDRYYQPADLEEQYVTRDQRRPIRRWEVPIVAVDPPIGEPQGTDTANLCAIAETYPTFADLTATGYTWGAVASGQASEPPIADGYGEDPYGSGPYGDGG